VVIRVSDTGYGIPEKYHQKIFEPDFRVPEHTNKANGTGLGLFICKQLIENQGGFLELESSEVAVGSTFALKLPIL
jgi:two-component system phosphate regulon sensor histidine kinase PhoR